MNTAQKIIKGLLDKGMTKWKISKTVGVSWRTVRFWEQGFMTPNEENLKKLIQLEKEGK